MAVETIADRIEEDAVAGVQSVSAGGTTVSGMPIKDRIEAERYLTMKTAKTRNHCGLIFRTLEPQGNG